MASLAYCWETGPKYQSWKGKAPHPRQSPAHRTSEKLGSGGSKTDESSPRDFRKSRWSQQHTEFHPQIDNYMLGQVLERKGEEAKMPPQSVCKRGSWDGVSSDVPV